MAITGVSSISGEQIIAAGALSARSAATALYDENGNAITSYLTAVPEGYATTGDLNDLVTSISETYQPTAGMTAYQPAGDYLTTADSGNFYTTANESGFITGVDLTPYQTIEGMTAYQEVGDYYSASNPSGFITGVDLAPYQTTAGMTAYATTADVTGKQDALTFDYDSNDNISAINGSALAGQGGGSNVTTANTGNDYNINVDGLDVYGTVTTKSESAYGLVTSYADVQNYQLYSYTSFNMNYTGLAQSNMAKFTINDYVPNQIYCDGDILSFDVIFSGAVYTGNWPDYGKIDFSSNIGNVTIDKTHPTIPPITITGKIEYPDEVLTAEGNAEFKIIYSSDKEFQANNFDWNFDVGASGVTGTSSISGIYIPNINDITAMSASIGDVETLLASL